MLISQALYFRYPYNLQLPFRVCSVCEPSGKAQQTLSKPRRGTLQHISLFSSIVANLFPLFSWFLTLPFFFLPRLLPPYSQPSWEDWNVFIICLLSGAISRNQCNWSGVRGEGGDGAQLVHGLNLLNQVLVKETKPFNVMGHVWHRPESYLQVEHSYESFPK